MSAWWRLHESLAQLGPGSDASTLRALEELGPLPEHPRILDLGCGSGRQTLALARSTAGKVMALDLLGPFLDQLRQRARELGVSDRIRPVRADMNHQFDLLWSEGALYIPGFEAGLSRWRPTLRPGGLAAVTELSWIGEPPEEARHFWETAYPGMADVATNRERAARAGYDVLSTFELPRSDWEAYYGPMEERSRELRPEYEGDASSLAMLSGHHDEVRILEESENSYTYVFYLLRATASDRN
jgi:SAM-dependent methyltransferase